MKHAGYEENLIMEGRGVKKNITGEGLEIVGGNFHEIVGTAGLNRFCKNAIRRKQIYDTNLIVLDDTLYATTTALPCMIKSNSTKCSATEMKSERRLHSNQCHHKK
jgi:hypothetical protein